MSRNDPASPRILLTGQCSLHWGRMEFGNIGNYYVAEPLVRELHRVFPGARIRTTFQFSDEFCLHEQVTCLPIDLYYGWNGRDLATARAELAVAEAWATSDTHQSEITPYVDEVIHADLVIDYSGDIFGDNADLLGPDRFEVGLCKLRTAQRLGKPTAMIAGSPGPFGRTTSRQLARDTLAGCALLTTREELSLPLLAELGCNTRNVHPLACPAFLFGSDHTAPAVRETLARIQTRAAGRPVVGFVLCGWSFTKGPFDRWPRSDEEYDPFAEAVEILTNELGAAVCLLSHANGFPPPPAPFRLQHGRDYPIIQQLQSVVERRGRSAGPVFTLDSVHPAAEMHALLGSLDMLVSGRVHAAVASLAQQVPTLIIDYGHEPRAHKLRGFAQVAGVEDCVADPRVAGDLVTKIRSCWNQRAALRRHLAKRMPQVRALAHRHFDLLPQLLAGQPVAVPPPCA